MVLEIGEPIDSALKRFQKQCEKSGTLYDIKKAFDRHTKRGDRKRRKRSRARARNRKFLARRAAELSPKKGPRPR